METHRAWDATEQLWKVPVSYADPIDAAAHCLEITSQPTVHAIDNAHWADIELLRALSADVQHGGFPLVVLLISGRAGFHHSGSTQLRFAGGCPVLLHCAAGKDRTGVACRGTLVANCTRRTGRSRCRLRIDQRTHAGSVGANRAVRSQTGPDATQRPRHFGVYSRRLSRESCRFGTLIQAGCTREYARTAPPTRRSVYRPSGSLRNANVTCSDLRVVQVGGVQHPPTRTAGTATVA